MIVPLFARSGTLLNETAYHFFSAFDGKTSVNPNYYETVIPFSATLKNLYVNFSIAPGFGDQRIFTVFKNGSSTSLQAIAGATDISASDTTNTVSLVAGDTIYLRSSVSGTPANGSFLRIYAELDTTDRYLVAGVAGGSTYTGTNQVGIIGGTSSLFASNSETVPHDCTLQELYFDTEVAPGSGNSMTLKVYKNGTEQTAATTTISDTATQASKTSIGLSFAVGDRVYCEVIDNSGSGSIAKKWSLGFQPSTSNETALYSLRGGSLSSTSTYYFPFNSTNNATTSSTSNILYSYNSDTTFSNLHVRLDNSPAVGNSYDVTLLQNGSATSLTASVADNNTTASDTTNSVSVTSGDYFQLQSVPVSSPNARIMDISIVATVSGSTNVTVTPTSNALTLAQTSPTVTTVQNVSFSVVANSMTLDVTSPAIATQTNITTTPTANALVLDVTSPTVTNTVNITVSPTSNQLVLSQSDTTIITTSNLTVTTASNTLTIGQSSPTIITDGNLLVIPAANQFTIANTSPTADVVFNNSVIATSNTLTLDVTNPSITADAIVSSTTNSLIMDTTSPSVAADGMVSVTANELILSLGNLTILKEGNTTATPTANEFILANTSPFIRVINPNDAFIEQSANQLTITPGTVFISIDNTWYIQLDNSYTTKNSTEWYSSNTPSWKSTVDTSWFTLLSTYWYIALNKTYTEG